MEEKCLLAVFAHPDDECPGTGGVLRKYSDDGVKTEASGFGTQSGSGARQPAMVPA